MPELWNYEWPNVNTQRRYPLAEGTSAKSGDMVLPNDLLADLVIPVNTGISPPVDPTLFHVAQVGVFSGGVMISFGYNGAIFGSVSVPLQGFHDYATYRLIGVEPFQDTEGWVTIGRLDSIMQYPGAWTFNLESARLTPSVIRPNIRAVTGIAVRSGSVFTAPFTGDITLRAGANMRLRAVAHGGGATVYFDAIDTGGYTEACDCVDLTPALPCITSINGTPPTNGNITITGGPNFTVDPGDGGINIDDSSSEPCCECPELQKVTEDLEEMMSQVDTLDTAAAQLTAVVNNLSDNVLSSKLTGTVPRSNFQ